MVGLTLCSFLGFLTYFFWEGVLFLPFLEHGPKPFPSGCACPTEGYFLMGPRQAVGSGRGRAGRGRECHLRPRTTLPPLLPISPSSSPGAHLPERPPPPPLQSPGPVPRRQARQAGPLRRRAACFDSLLLPAASCSAGLPPVQARTGGEIGGINSSAPLPTFPCFAISTFICTYLPHQISSSLCFF